MFENILVEVAALAGFSAIVSLIINILKFFNVVKDGTADKWVAGFNLVGVIGLYVAKLFVPDWNVLPVDNVLGEVAVVGSYIFSYVTMLLGSKLTYLATKGLPIIGTSNSLPKG